MFTIAWKKPNIGYEEVFQVKRVWLRQKTQPTDPETCLGVEQLGEDTVTYYTEGSFYVMNENGKTVAAYHLGVAAMVDQQTNNEPLHEGLLK